MDDVAMHVRQSSIDAVVAKRQLRVVEHPALLSTTCS